MKSAQVADDQLAQSRQRTEEDSRKLASRVTLWQGKNELFIANRSLDPTHLYLTVAMPLQTGHKVVPLGVAPPCTRFSVPSTTLRTHIKRITEENGHQVTGLLIREPSGAVWMRREQTGALLRLPIQPQSLINADTMATLSGISKNLLLNDAVKLTGLEDCGFAS